MEVFILITKNNFIAIVLYSTSINKNYITLMLFLYLSASPLIILFICLTKWSDL